MSVNLKEFIIMRQGKTCVLYAGLLALAHEDGLHEIKTAIVQLPTAENKEVAVCTASVTMCRNNDYQTFTGIGDAAPGNVASMMRPHLLRMAETRAKARALRDAVNVGMAALEELAEEEPTQEEKPKPTNTAKKEEVKSPAPDLDSKITAIQNKRKKLGLGDWSPPPNFTEAQAKAEWEFLKELEKTGAVGESKPVEVSA